MRLRSGLLAALAALALAACQGNVSTPFPPGVEPFPDGEKPGEIAAPAGEELRTTSSKTDMIRAYGRGLVLAPPHVVWIAAKTPEALVARCQTNERTFTRNNEPDHEMSFLVHYVVNDIVTIEWDDQWRGDVVTGTPEAPELAMVKHQKVEGSDFIYVSEGTVQLRATDKPGETELWLVEHLDALSGSADQVTRGMRDQFDALVALVHGRAIPSCP